MKKPFVTKEKLEEIVKEYPTPFHLYDEKGIRDNVKELYDAFSWNKGYKEYFAVKATPNPFLINILHEYGCGCDCSSMTELMLSEALGIVGEDVMFSSNDTPEEEFRKAAEMGGIINLDDITHIEKVEKAVGYLPKTMSCRYNPGGVFKISNGIMDNPGDAKYGMTTEQIEEAKAVILDRYRGSCPSTVPIMVTWSGKVSQPPAAPKRAASSRRYRIMFRLRWALSFRPENSPPPRCAIKSLLFLPREIYKGTPWVLRPRRTQSFFTSSPVRIHPADQDRWPARPERNPPASAGPAAPRAPPP